MACTGVAVPVSRHRNPTPPFFLSKLQNSTLRRAANNLIYYALLREPASGLGDTPE
jgi:hypothetical protein